MSPTDQPPSPWVCTNPQNRESMRAAGFVRIGTFQRDDGLEVDVWLTPEPSTE